MKCISAVLPLVVCVCLWTGCSKTEEQRMLTDAEITAAIEGQWVKTHQITRSYRDGVEQDVFSSGYGSKLPLCIFTHSGKYFQENINNTQWPSGENFEVVGRCLNIGGFIYGDVSIDEGGRTMVWVKERTDFGLRFRTETYLQRVNEE